LKYIDEQVIMRFNITYANTLSHSILTSKKISFVI
jgi:hypothetical protein